MAGGAIRGAPNAAARCGLPDAGLSERGGRRRPGGRLAPQPRRHERGREPRRLADDGGCARLAEHAPLTQGRREEPIGVRVPEPIIDRADGMNPEHEALLADSVGLALLVVLETLSPAERLAFVLHDIFAVPFDEIAPIVDRSPEAARQLASRARRVSEGRPRSPTPTSRPSAKVLDAFTAAARDGNFEALLEVLDPDVVLRADFGSAGESREVRGARLVAGQALSMRARGWSSSLRSSMEPPELSRSSTASRSRWGASRSGAADRRAGHPRRPGAAPPPRSDDPRRLATSSTDASGACRTPVAEAGAR